MNKFWILVNIFSIWWTKSWIRWTFFELVNILLRVMNLSWIQWKKKCSWIWKENLPKNSGKVKRKQEERKRKTGNVDHIKKCSCFQKNVHYFKKSFINSEMFPVEENVYEFKKWSSHLKKCSQFKKMLTISRKIVTN